MLFFVGMDMDVIMRVTIVRDQGTSVVVARQLNCVNIDCVDWGEECLSLVNDYSMVCSYSGCSELRVNVCAHGNVTTNLWQLNSVGTEWGRLFFGLIHYFWHKVHVMIAA